MIKNIVAIIVGFVVGASLSSGGGMNMAAELDGTSMMLGIVAAIGVGLLLIFKASGEAAKLLGIALVFTGFGLWIGPIIYPAS